MADLPRPAEQSILGSWRQPSCCAEDLLATVQGGAVRDWKAAAWLLTHHPDLREHFGDLAHDERIRRELVARVVAALAAADLPPDLERRTLLQLQAHGVGTAAAGTGDW